MRQSLVCGLAVIACLGSAQALAKGGPTYRGAIGDPSLGSRISFDTVGGVGKIRKVKKVSWQNVRFSCGVTQGIVTFSGSLDRTIRVKQRSGKFLINVTEPSGRSVKVDGELPKAGIARGTLTVQHVFIDPAHPDCSFNNKRWFARAKG